MHILPGAEPFTHDGNDVGVLLCHGLTGTPQSLRPWAERLADDGLTVRLPRLPGHGTTWQQLNMTRWQDWLAVADGSLDELTRRCRAVVVGGLSMGGALAATLAATRPADVHGLVLVNPAVAHDDRRLGLLPLLHRVLPSLAGIGSDIAKPGVTELAYDRTPLRALHSFIATQAAVVRDLPRVTAPLLLLRSRTDHVVPAGSSALLLSRVSSKDVTEVVLEHSFHVATLDHDADVIEKASLAFIQRVTA